ncbi:MAG: ankyrin repeat domain-containing protein [Planctomycetota bacterium]|nr:ankyrin repeat domain-containing protein [Planctomycetota bacterium]
MLKRGAALDAADKQGRTPLHAAAYKARAAAMELLLDAGAEPLARDAAGRTPAEALARLAQP